MKVKPIVIGVIAASVAAGAAILAISTHAAAPDTTQSVGTNSIASDSLFPDPLVASGTGVQVKRSELDDVVNTVQADAAAQGRTISPEQLLIFKARALETMIDVQLLDQQANEADKATGQENADKAMAQLVKKFGSQDMLSSQLAAAGTTLAQFRRKIMNEATATAELQRALGINVSNADVQAYYDKNPQVFEEPEMVHVRDILFLTIDPQTQQPLADDVVSSKLKEANEVLEKARAGADFSKLAERYSDDPQSKEKGGELQPFPRTNPNLRMRPVVPPEVEAAAFSMTNNQISDLIKTVYGDYIIQLINKIPSKKLALADKLPSADPTSDTTVAQYVKEVLTQQKTQKLEHPYLVKLKKAADVKILDPNLSSAIESLSNTNAAAD
ncbi:MAG: peptidylprolyl isomerase [Limisphaerales bacterium]